MLAEQEKLEMYRWHFVNRLANHLCHLAFHRSRQRIGIFHETSKASYTFIVKLTRTQKNVGETKEMRNV